MGTISTDPMMRRLCEQQAQTMVRYWETWQHWTPRAFKDSEVSDADLRKYSLILVGGPDANLVTKRLIGKLPLEISSDKVTIDGRAFPVQDAALKVVYPHPLNPDRYLLIIAGTSPAGMYFARRYPDDVDFCISDDCFADPDEGRPDEKVLPVTGSFDHAWRLDPSYLAVADATVRAQCRVRRPPRYPSAAVAGARLMLGDLLESSAQGSFTEMMRGTNWQGKPMVLGARTYSDGIAANIWGDPNAVEFDLSGGEWKRLRGVIGIEVNPEEESQAAKDSTRVVFLVKGDGKELYRSDPFLWTSAPRELDVDVAGVKALWLEVIGGSSPRGSVASADWADLRLER